MQERGLVSIRNSALWAAYGDALGFVSELVDGNGLKRRINSIRITRTEPWRRRVGGRFGVDVLLPAGCYSDDTQLRLSTCRAIRGNGEFDVEAFAKVELPVWLSYGLGAGRGTKAAASSLGHQSVNWFSNFFDGQRTNYINCGGNGAAMRVQPHVWSAKDRSKPETFILDVVKNSICTHGHPRGILGAVFHALCLAMSYDRGQIPGPDEWAEAINFFPKVSSLIRNDEELRVFWVPTWEGRVGESIEAAFNYVRDECFEDILLANNYVNGGRPDQTYSQLVEAIGGKKEDQRGSGTKTAIIASVLSWLYRDEYPAMALQVAANQLFSDTDTIGTMAGAILGCINDRAPNGSLLDSKYIETEAARLFKISQGHQVESFAYPDLGMWQPPPTQLDVVGVFDGHLAVAGLGIASTKSEEHKNQSKDGMSWQWLELEFGESVLVKRRNVPRPLPIHSMPTKLIPPGSIEKQKVNSEQRQESRTPSQSGNYDYGGERGLAFGGTIHELTNVVIESGFDEALIGRHVLSLATHPDGIERVIAYVSIIAKARIARINNRHNNAMKDANKEAVN